MRPMTAASCAELLTTDKSTCISLYLPTLRQHPENAQDPIRFRNVLNELDESLREAHDAGQVREYRRHMSNSLAIRTSGITPQTG